MGDGPQVKKYIDRKGAESSGTAHVRAEKSEGEHQAALDKEKFQGPKPGLARGGGEDMPKQADYPDTPAWMKAVREWRAKKESDPKVAGQKKALQEMGKK